MKATKQKGLPPGYSEKDIPGSSNPPIKKTVSPEQYDMIHTLLELPGGTTRKIKK